MAPNCVHFIEPISLCELQDTSANPEELTFNKPCDRTFKEPCRRQESPKLKELTIAKPRDRTFKEPCKYQGTSTDLRELIFTKHHVRKLQDVSPDLKNLTLAELRDRTMTEPEGPRLTNLLTEVASRLDLKVCLEDFHVAQQLFYVSGLNTKREISKKWTYADAEKLYWQRRRLQKAMIRITKPNWRARHRCDEFCVDDCYFVCSVYDKMCYNCVIMYPVHAAKYPRRSYLRNLIHLLKNSYRGKSNTR